MTTAARPPRLLFTVREAAPILGMGKSKLYRLVREGKVPHRKIDGAVWFNQDDLDAIVESAARPVEVG